MAANFLVAETDAPSNIEPYGMRNGGLVKAPHGAEGAQN
jgi:hypothetical protein